MTVTDNDGHVPSAPSPTLPAAILADGIGIKYSLRFTKKTTLQRSFINLFQREAADEFWALRDVTFKLVHGESLAVIGPNGAGKSTFFNCLTGVLRPTSGRIVFNGEDITGLPPNMISQKGIARSYQITNIMPNATALENVRIAAQSRRHAWNIVKHHSEFPDINEKAEAALELVGLLSSADELAANLSHGQQRNLEIGIALATVMLSFLMMITRRKAIPQVIGFLSMENGLFFAATSATYGMPMVVELGIALDVLVAMLILGVFFFQIREQFDSLDLKHMERLREPEE